MSTFYRIAKCNIAVISVITTYVAVYIFIITYGHGIPYVMDNNETFSALNHAYNLWNFDFFKSFGLTDEAVSPFAAAHPVVHTHQGNFPRLFTFLLFMLGARGVELQIWITTFTVGLASVLMANHYFQRQAGKLFATIATLMLMTDYLLFAQWQVNTYRVWHGFFLFACLLCVHGLSEWRRLYWAFATIILYAALLYWELVFASFVTVTAGAYAIWIYRRTPRLIVTAGLTQALGAAVGLGILVVQLIFYLGWQDFLIDIKSTYTARNFMEDRGATFEAIREFYSMKNIIFLYNFQSGTALNGIVPFLHSIVDNILQVHTLIFVLIALSLATAAIIANMRFSKSSSIEPKKLHLTTVGAAILVPSLFTFLLILAFGGDVGLGLSSDVTAKKILLLASILVVAVATSIGLRRLANVIAGTPPGFLRCAITAVYFLGVGVLILVLEDQQLWSGALVPVNEWLEKIIVGVGVFVAGLLLLTGTRPILGKWENAPVSLVPFFVCGALGYLFVYKFNAGYLHSGYLRRLCPLFVFHIDAFLALGLFSAFAISANLIRRVRAKSSWAACTSLTILSGSLCISLVAYWGALQFRYITIVPPDRLSFAQSLKSLASPNEGIISNTYAVPFAYFAKTWGYMESNMHDIGTYKDSKEFVRKEYLWFADRESNEAYRRPGTLVCFEPLVSYGPIYNYAVHGFFDTPRCSDMALATDLKKLEKNIADCIEMKWFMSRDDAWRLCAASHKNVNEDDSHGVEGMPQTKLVMRDDKHGSWAVYRMEWSQSNRPAMNSRH